MNAAAAVVTAKLTAKVEGWHAHAAKRAERATAFPHSFAVVGQPYIVINDGFAVRVQGRAAVPTAIVPGCAGISHFDRKDAERVASLMGDGWRVVAAADVGQIEIERLTSLIALFCA